MESNKQFRTLFRQVGAQRSIVEIEQTRAKPFGFSIDDIEYFHLLALG
jgi:hypothetical protein